MWHLHPKKLCSNCALPEVAPNAMSIVWQQTIKTINHDLIKSWSSWWWMNFKEENVDHQLATWGTMASKFYKYVYTQIGWESHASIRVLCIWFLQPHSSTSCSSQQTSPYEHSQYLWLLPTQEQPPTLDNKQESHKATIANPFFSPVWVSVV